MKDQTHRIEQPGSYASFTDWIKRTDAEVEILRERSLPHDSGDMIQVRLAEGFSDPPTSDLALALMTRGKAPADTKIDLGFGRFNFTPQPGRFCVFTPEAPSDIEGPGPYEFLHLGLPWAAIRSRVESVLDRPMPHMPEFIHSRAHVDTMIESTTHRLWNVSQTASPANSLLADGLVNVLLGRLLQIGEEPIPDPGKRSQLHPRKYAAVLAYIDAYLCDTLTLDDLSAVAGCSRFHFARLFKASAGEPPLAYVNRQRVERAQNLILDHPEWTLAAIALACGFADQSHLNRHFKRIVGVTPGQYRGEAGR